MFDNVGGKLKRFAKILFWIALFFVTLKCAASFTSITTMLGLSNIPTSFTLLLTLVVSLLAGYVIAYILAAAVYGFGQMLENNDVITRASKKIISEEQEESKDNKNNA